MEKSVAKWMTTAACVRLCLAKKPQNSLANQVKFSASGLLAIAVSHSRFRWINTIPLHIQFFSFSSERMIRSVIRSQFTNVHSAIVCCAHLKYKRSCRVTFRKLFNQWRQACINKCAHVCNHFFRAQANKKCLLYRTRILLISNMESLSICCTSPTTMTSGFANCNRFYAIYLPRYLQPGATSHSDMFNRLLLFKLIMGCNSKWNVPKSLHHFTRRSCTGLYL